MITKCPSSSDKSLVLNPELENSRAQWPMGCETAPGTGSDLQGLFIPKQSGTGMAGKGIYLEPV